MNMKQIVLSSVEGQGSAMGSLRGVVNALLNHMRRKITHWSIWTIALGVLLTPAIVTGETIVLDFDNGLGSDVHVDSGVFTVDTSQGTLRLTKGPSVSGFHQAKIWALYLLGGDFEVTVDFELFEFPHPPTFNNQMQLDATADITFLIARQKGLLGEPGVYEGPIDGYTAWNGETGVTAAEPNSSDTVGKMRITRSGNMWFFWYMPEGEGAFTLLESLQGPTEQVMISMDLQNNGTGDPLDAAFDNLILSAETIEPLFSVANLTISPPSGKFFTTQNFDLGLIVEAEGLSVIGGTAALDGTDVTAALAGCINGFVGTLTSGGQTFRCPGLTGGLFGPGTHTVSVTLDLSDGSHVSDTVTWEVLANTEP